MSAEGVKARGKRNASDVRVDLPIVRNLIDFSWHEYYDKSVNLFSRQPAFARQPFNIGKLLFLLPLLVVLPVVVWAVLTQRIELRKKAAPAPIICWNKAVEVDGQLQWPDSCKGEPTTTAPIACAQLLVPLTDDEIMQYNDWVAIGKPYIPDCGIPMATPTPDYYSSPTPVALQQECGLCSAPNDCMSGLTCQYVPTPTPSCPNGPDGPCSMPANYPYQACVKIDGTSACPPLPPSPTYYPTPTYYSTPTPYASPYISPTPWSTPSPTPTPTPACNRQPFTLTMVPSNQTEYPGQTVGYTVTVANNDSSTCSPTSLNLSGVAPPAPASGWSFGITPNPYFVLQSGQTTQFTLSAASPISATPDTYTIGAQLIDASYTINVSTSATLTLKQPPPLHLKFLVKFIGVTGAGAEGAQITVKFLKPDGDTLALTEPLTVTHRQGGVYEAYVKLTNPPPAGERYAVFVKGEKHLVKKFCTQTGQTTNCSTTFGSITMPVPTTDEPIHTFDFSGLALEPGDLPEQDGRADKADFDKIKAVLGKASTDVTAEDRMVADLNYDGVINIMDAFLMRQTLETRYDEQ